MSIKFYNTLTKRKEKFQPITKGEVKLYTCGPTVYDTVHIGNFRTFLFEDLLKRYLFHKGFKIKHVMNITDVDDKTILRSNKEQKPIAELTQHYEELFYNDLVILNIWPAKYFPKATEHIEEMIKMIGKLIDKGFAYKSEDKSIYFNIAKYDQYGKLANLNLTGQKRNQRVVTDEYSKDNPQDFVLWKAWKPEDGKVFWDSPWGKGRPGWHIECSAMSNKYLGDNFDIHCGGVDNIFPHHENEIAQSECANNKTFVNYWLHSEHLLVDGGKMSKSAGNFYKISDLIDMGFTPPAIRYLLLSGHYRTNINFSIGEKHEALKTVQRIEGFYDRLKRMQKKSESIPGYPDAYELFNDALDDDLNTPVALAIFFNWLRETNKKIDKNLLTDVEVGKAINFVDDFEQIFGIEITIRIDVPQNIIDLANQRQTARLKKDWAKADSIRNQILKLGWIVEDLPHIGYNLKSVLEK